MELRLYYRPMWKYRPRMKINSKTNKGKTCFVYKDNKFRDYYRKKKNGNVCFWWTVKTCKTRIETNDVTVVAEYGDRDHSDKVA